MSQSKPKHRRESLAALLLSAAILLDASRGASAAGSAAGRPAIPADLERFVRHATSVEFGGRAFTVAKIDLGDGRLEEVAFDEKGGEHSADEIRRGAVAKAAPFGRIHPTLRAAVDRSPTARFPVLVWLATRPLPILDKPTVASSTFPKELAALGEKHRSNVDALEAEKADLVAKLGLGKAERIESRVGSPAVIARLDREQVSKLAGNASVRFLLPYDARGVEDLAAAMAISSAADVVASGVDGSGIDVAVWERCPDDTSDLDVEASFSSEEGLNCTFTQHARHTTGIIHNTTATPGFAPGTTMYSADQTSLDALDWAIDDKRVSVLNQSFHRNVEIGDGMQADDFYKDFKVLQYPWPTIVQAAGNWCGPGTSCFEGGSDARDEFVNHKGFNSISIGNHDDTATAMAPSSCFVNPTSPHGDRELPELAANGTGVDAVGLVLSGTSMASPAVAGSVALLQDANALLRIWPEANRALLFAGAHRNVATHAGETTGGEPVADAPGTWWEDVSAGRDAFDGAGALDAERSVAIAKRRWKGAALARGFDVGTFTDSSFERGVSKKTWKVKLPARGKRRNVKVALAWNSTATIDGDAGANFASVLGLDLDLLVHDADGNLVASSHSYDNSYEIAEFRGQAGRTYTISVLRWRADAGAWSWYGVAWDLQ